MKQLLKLEDVENKIVIIREKPVLLDSDVAELYDIETKRVNEAVSNNPEKFPEGYILDLEKHEWEKLKSKFSTSIKGGKVKLPKAFTEKGLYMLATILKSQKAVETTLAIVETFVKFRELSRNIASITEVKTEPEQKELMKKSGEIIAELLDDGLSINASETTIELNLAMFKIKHTVNRKK
jgi:phage regulator Rha-like protein